MHLCLIFKYCIDWPAGGGLLTETVQVTVEWTELCWTEELWVLLSSGVPCKVILNVDFFPGVSDSSSGL